MCLAIPGQVVRWIERDFPFCEAEVLFAGVSRRVNMACVMDVEVGEYVVVHAGIAISKVNAEAAASILAELSASDVDEWREGQSI